MAYSVIDGKLVRTVGNKHKPRPHKYPYGRDVIAPYTAPKAHVSEFPKDKGQWNGHCNRSACLAPGAVWYNRGSHAFYCQSCAHMLSNDPFNKRDAEELFGPGMKLCYLVTSEEEASQLHVSTRV